MGDSDDRRPPLAAPTGPAGAFQAENAENAEYAAVPKQTVGAIPPECCQAEDGGHLLVTPPG